MTQNTDSSLAQRILNAAGVGQKSETGEQDTSPDDDVEQQADHDEEDEDVEHEADPEDVEAVAVEVAQALGMDVDAVSNHLMEAYDESKAAEGEDDEDEPENTDAAAEGDNGEMKAGGDGAEGDADLETKLSELGVATQDDLGHIEAKLEEISESMVTEDDVEAKLDGYATEDTVDQKLDSTADEIAQKADFGSTPDPSTDEESQVDTIADVLGGGSE